uniref:SH3 domain-binding protein 5-like protein n=1 Tax=Romanomermis culicivorax TaxID=13658 RepID=A0A915J312_ROMCU
MASVRSNPICLTSIESPSSLPINIKSPISSEKSRSHCNDDEDLAVHDASDFKKGGLSPSSSAQSLSPKSACDLNRVHEELEKLNIATDVINKLELQLDEARAAFREIQSSWSQRLEQLGKKLGSCIEKSRPYYEARLKVQYAQQEAQRAALRFERANSMHAVAKQQVALTQESLDRQGAKNVDPACLEVLNHHVQRVNEAEIERLKSEQEHQGISRMVSEATSMLLSLEQELRRNIRKSKPYFDARYTTRVNSHSVQFFVDFTKVLEKQKELILRLEAEIRQKKADYNTSLRNLETISEQIHEQRQTHSRKSSAGVENLKSSERHHQEDNVSMPPSDPEDSKAPKTKNEDSNFVATDRGRAPRGLSVTGLKSGGVILLAQELSAYDWLQEDVRRQAFALPQFFAADDLDVRYQTAPEGVKPFPSPPETPVSESDCPDNVSYGRRRSRSESLSSSSTGEPVTKNIPNYTSSINGSSKTKRMQNLLNTLPSTPSSLDPNPSIIRHSKSESPVYDKSESSSLASLEPIVTVIDDCNVALALQEPNLMIEHLSQ